MSSSEAFIRSLFGEVNTYWPDPIAGSAKTVTSAENSQNRTDASKYAALCDRIILVYAASCTLIGAIPHFYRENRTKALNCYFKSSQRFAVLVDHTLEAQLSECPIHIEEHVLMVPHLIQIFVLLDRIT
jgi:hypothetical protein